MTKRTKEVKIGNVIIGGQNPLVLIAGPCVIESEASLMKHALGIKIITERLNVPLIFKASFDKANRTSIDSFRGPGINKGLKLLAKVKKSFNVPVISDIHSVDQAKKAGEVLDILQIPAFLSRQTDILVAAAKTKRAVNVKKGQFMSPHDIKNVAVKITSSGNDKLIITERGTSFGYNNLVSDFRSISIMKDFGYPVCYDATHSVQRPGGMGNKSGGDSRFVPDLSKAAVACGVNALFIEIHEDPKKALSDGPNMLKLEQLPGLLKTLRSIEEAVK